MDEWRVMTKPRYPGRSGVLGMTLIELMIALAIVGVLTSIAMPMYASYRDRIDRATAAKDVGVLQTLISDYRLEMGAYPVDLAAVRNGARMDPWGRPYVYVDLTIVSGNGKARKDHKFNPINSDFDLYSLGKDGVSQQQLTQKDSLDDIVRANDGAFIGMAGDYSP